MDLDFFNHMHNISDIYQHVEFSPLSKQDFQDTVRAGLPVLDLGHPSIVQPSLSCSLSSLESLTSQLPSKYPS